MICKGQDFLSFKAAPYLNTALFASQILKMLVPFYADCGTAVTVTLKAAVVCDVHLESGREDVFILHEIKYLSQLRNKSGLCKRKPLQ